MHGVQVRVCSHFPASREKRRPSVGALCSDIPRIADELHPRKELHFLRVIFSSVTASLGKPFELCVRGYLRGNALTVGKSGHL